MGPGLGGDLGVSQFLEAFHRRDESITAEEAELAGPWAVQAAKGGFGVFRGLPVASDETRCAAKTIVAASRTSSAPTRGL
jgi:hypothetical protein